VKLSTKLSKYKVLTKTIKQYRNTFKSANCHFCTVEHCEEHCLKIAKELKKAEYERFELFFTRR